jgi:hypothetical protein
VLELESRLVPEKLFRRELRGEIVEEESRQWKARPSCNPEGNTMQKSPTIQFQLNGWKALVGLAVVAAFVVYRAFVASSALHAEALPELKRTLVGEYSSIGLAPLEQAMKSGDRQAAARYAKELEKVERITFGSARVKGQSGKRVLRVEIRVDGDLPPDGQPVRYFFAEHSLVTGWRIRGRARAWNYYSKLF